MSKKHFEMIANTIASLIRENAGRSEQEKIRRNVLRHLAEDFADRFQAKAPRFNRARFLKAADPFQDI